LHEKGDGIAGRAGNDTIDHAGATAADEPVGGRDNRPERLIDVVAV
jgi:hypothetical protein